MAQTLFMNRRGTEPYARWCERTGVVKLPPTRLLPYCYLAKFNSLFALAKIRHSLLLIYFRLIFDTY